MTKPSREEYEDVAYIIDNGGTLTGRGRQVAAAALRIAAEQVGEREKVAELIADGNGYWRACSGCQEGTDGQINTKDYPYSALFQCHPGGGCHECGGIGVIWESSWPRLDHSTATPVSGWRSMDSAPRDGTRVLLWYEELDPHTIQAEWRDDRGWVDVWNNDPIEVSGVNWVEPKFWQPLPSPPGEGR